MIESAMLAGTLGALAAFWGWQAGGNRSGFSLAEYSQSSTADRLGIDNRPVDPGHIDALRALHDAVRVPLFSLLDAPRITSGYRSPELNRAIGGASGSQHSKGEAIDIATPIGSIAALRVLEASGIDYDQAIAYHPTMGGQLHVSYTTRRANRGQSLYKHADGELRGFPWTV